MGIPLTIHPVNHQSVGAYMRPTFPYAPKPKNKTRVIRWFFFLKLPFIEYQSEPDENKYNKDIELATIAIHNRRGLYIPRAGTVLEPSLVTLCVTWLTRTIYTPILYIWVTVRDLQIFVCIEMIYVLKQYRISTYGKERDSNPVTLSKF